MGHEGEGGIVRSAYLRTVNRVLNERSIREVLSVDGIVSEFRLINNFGNVYFFSLFSF